MTAYIDSSVILRLILGTKNAYRDFKGIRKLISSELLLIECHRVLDRYRLEKILTDDQMAEVKTRLQEIIDGLYIVEISSPVKKRAREFFPTVVGTLDAIHLATALLWQEEESSTPLAVITHDHQMAICARALGLKIVGI